MPVLPRRRHEVSEPAIELEPEVHPDAIRITLPRLATWGILTIAPATTVGGAGRFEKPAPDARSGPPGIGADVVGMESVREMSSPSIRGSWSSASR